MYDAENRLTAAKQGATTIATFVYDGDGNRVKATVGNLTTAYVGAHYEYTTQTTPITPVPVAPLNNGVACQDGATGTGYLIYTAESVHTRFSAHPPHAQTAAHFI